MVAMPLIPTQNDDPRKLRELLQRVASLAGEHRLTSVVVGMSGLDSDVLFPEVVDFVGSSLRVEDTIFRMTRNRAVFFLADADETQAAEIMQRVLSGFHERFAATQRCAVSLSFFEVTPDDTEVTVKEVLPALFAPPAESH
jgi:hypothetical protein